MHDPYAVLGVDRGAPAAEIKRAYRKLAMAWHPDRNPTREAEERFKQLQAAYELVLDPVRLAEWEGAQDEPDDPDAPPDRAAEAAAAQAKKSGRAGRHAADEPEATAEAAPSDRDTTHLTLHLELEEAAHGCTRTITLASERSCPGCVGTGRREHTHSLPCAECKGVGRVGRGGGKCEACGGRGYVRVTPCPDCVGRGRQESTRQLEVRIPAAMLPGERLRLARQHRPREDEPASDLYVAIAIRPHPLFTLDGRDLDCQIPVGLFRLLHGGPIEVPTLAGTQQIEIAPYPGHGLDYRVPGLGYPGRHGRDAGQLRLHLHPVFPRHFDDAERKLLARLDKAMLADSERCAPELAAWAKKLDQRAG